MELSIYLLSLSDIASKISSGFVALTPVLGILLPFILKKLGGFKTKIFAGLTVVSSGLMFFNESVLPGLATFFGVDTNGIMALLVALNAIAVWILRNYTTGEAQPISELPQALRARKK